MRRKKRKKRKKRRRTKRNRWSHAFQLASPSVYT